MAAPATPSNLYLQQGNGTVYLSWDISTGSTSYKVYRSTNNVSFSLLGTATVNNYLDSTPTVNTQYYYTVLATNGSGDSAQTASQGIIATLVGKNSLQGLRLAAQQRADRVNSNFVTMPEWNSYINAAAYELRDLLVNTHEDYFLAVPYQVTTTGAQQYALPDGTSTYLNADGDTAQAFEKLVGVDLGYAGNTNAWVSIHKFDFIERNRYVYPNITASFAGVFNLRYRLMADKLFMIPAPSAGQTLRVWYIPRMSMLLQDTDVLDGVSGWYEYVIVDAAIRALQKEESWESVQALMMQKQALIKRIEESAMNRDVGQPDTISPTRRFGSGGGTYGGPGFDGSFGGY